MTKKLLFYSEEGNSACLGAECARAAGAEEVRVFGGEWRGQEWEEVRSTAERLENSQDIPELMKNRHKQMRAEGQEEEARE